jgi:very-short-patch-repair endonuclease
MRLMPHTNIDVRIRSTAKRLRGDQTDAERKMWRLLRSQGFEVLRFWNNEVMRNGDGCQQVIGDYIQS